MAQLHVDNFPDELKQTMVQWGQSQIPKSSLTRIVIEACQEWIERHVPKNPEDAERQAEIARLERELAALKRGE